MTRFSLGGTTQRFGTTVIGGSPLRLFRLTDAGAALFDAIAAGADVGDSPLVDRFVDAGVVHPQPASSPFTSDDVTVVVPTHGQPDVVPAGALVVDDGSRPPVEGAAIRLDLNRGPGAARNAGLHRVTTPLVAFVDTDVRVEPNWLDHLLVHFTDERVALVAPRITAGGDTAIARYEQAHNPLDLGDEPARIAPGTRVSYVPAAAIVCRVDALRTIGGFDEALRFGEDVDLVWRLVDAGYRCRYEPRSQAVHLSRSTWRQWARQRIDYGSSAAPLSAKHPGALAPVVLNGWSLSSWLLAATGRPTAGAVLGATSAAALVRKLPDLPPREAFRLGWTGNLRAGEQIAAAVRRAWWPILTVAAWRSRTARRILLASAIAARHPITLADDVAYAIGVWKGMVRERTARPLVPRLVAWPGRTQPLRSRT